MTPTLEELLFAALAWLLSLFIVAGVANHYTAKYYKAQASALESKRDALAKVTEAENHAKETVANSNVAAIGVKLALAQAQLDGETVESNRRLVALNGAVANIAQLKWVLDHPSGSAGTPATPDPGLLVPGNQGPSETLGGCVDGLTRATITIARNDPELQFCKQQVHGWVDWANEAVKEMQ